MTAFAIDQAHMRGRVECLAECGEGAIGLAGIKPLDAIDKGQWTRLAEAAIEPNIFFDPGFARAAFSLAERGGQARALVAHDKDGRLVGFLPVVSAWQALRLPVPAFIAHQPYSPLTAPLLDRDMPVAAAGALIHAAARAGAAILSLPAMTLEGAAGDTLRAAMAEYGVSPIIHDGHERAGFNARREVETYLREGLGAKRLKDLRRLRHRLDDEGAVRFDIAVEPSCIKGALERFLSLEAAGWKGKNGTGLGQKPGDAAFVRAMAADLGGRGLFEIAELSLDGRIIASGLVMKQSGRAFFFKIAYDEALHRFSPGVQLTLELTRHFAGDKGIDFADSTADADHPMIDPIWRERLAIGDMLIATRADDKRALPVAHLLAARRRARAWAKAQVHTIRKYKEKRR